MRDKASVREIEYPSRKSMFKIYLLSDIHLGNLYCDESLLRKVVYKIEREDNALWIGLGDYAEYIGRGDRRHLEEEYAQWLWGHHDVILSQEIRLRNILAPIADKCLGLIEGNHETSIKRHNDRDVYARLIEDISTARSHNKNILKMGVTGFVRIIFRRIASTGHKCDSWACDIYCTHGHVGGRKMGGKALRLQDLAGQVEADILCMGHSHQYMTFPIESRHVDQEGNIRTRTTTCVNAGSLLEFPEYAQQGDYPPTKPVVAQIWIKPDKKRVTVVNV